MKRSKIGKTFTFAAVAAFALVPAANAANKGCTNASLNGTFAYTSTGTIVAPPALAGPLAEVGTQTFDGNGGTTAAAMISQNGNLTPLTITGTYTVNPDCTGTMTLQVSPFGITVPVYFVLDNSLSEFQALEVSAGLVITRIARWQFPANDWNH